MAAILLTVPQYLHKQILRNVLDAKILYDTKEKESISMRKFARSFIAFTLPKRLK